MLTDIESRILAFERRWWQARGSKEEAIHAEFGLSPVRYYVALNRLLDDPEALAAEPVLVNRLRRIRDSRSTVRRRPAI